MEKQGVELGAELQAALARCAKRLARAAVSVETEENVATLDEDVLAQTRVLTDDDPEALRQLIDVHLHSFARLFGELRQALAKNDEMAARHTVHTLSGCIGYFGEKKLAQHILELGEALRNADAAAIEARAQELFHEYAAVGAALRKLRQAT